MAEDDVSNRVAMFSGAAEYGYPALDISGRRWELENEAVLYDWISPRIKFSTSFKAKPHVLVTLAGLHGLPKETNWISCIVDAHDVNRESFSVLVKKASPGFTLQKVWIRWLAFAAA